MILLDTCALLWLAQDQKKMSRLTLQKISNAPVVSVSAITGFEIGLKYRGGKLHLPAPPWEWFEGIISHHDISVLDLGIGICIKASELPPIHKDPCDRFIIIRSRQHIHISVTIQIHRINRISTISTIRNLSCCETF